MCLTEHPHVTAPLVEEDERLAEGFVVADDQLMRRLAGAGHLPRTVDRDPAAGRGAPR